MVRNLPANVKVRSQLANIGSACELSVGYFGKVDQSDWPSLALRARRAVAVRRLVRLSQWERGAGIERRQGISALRVRSLNGERRLEEGGPGSCCSLPPGET